MWLDILMNVRGKSQIVERKSRRGKSRRLYRLFFGEGGSQKERPQMEKEGVSKVNKVELGKGRMQKRKGNSLWARPLLETLKNQEETHGTKRRSSPRRKRKKRKT